MNPSLPIIVTGPAGSGKSRLAAELALLSGCKPINVGDVLHERLADRGIRVSNRREIGVIYIDRIGLQSYVDEVLGLLDPEATVDGFPGVIVDGVRLAAPLYAAASKGIRYFHVTRFLRQGEGGMPEPFDRDLDEVQRMADYLVPWAQDIGDLKALADGVLLEAQRRTRGQPGWRRPSGEFAIHGRR